MIIGAQCYTIRAYCQNERDFGRSMERIARSGYRCVQLSAQGPIPPQRIKAICDDQGLRIVLTHNPESDFLNNIDALIERHRLYGCRYAGLGYLPVYIQYYGIAVLILCLVLAVRPSVGKQALCLSAVPCCLTPIILNPPNPES